MITSKIQRQAFKKIFFVINFIKIQRQFKLNLFRKCELSLWKSANTFSVFNNLLNL